MSFTIKVKDFDLGQTLECGQCFRWHKAENGGYIGVAYKMQLKLTQCGDELTVEGASEAECADRLRCYLSLDEPYGKYKKILGSDEVLKKAITYAPGIRVMKQPFWETLCSFIISQNNNITRISRIVEKLCKQFGEDLGGYYDFPAPEALAKLAVDDLKCLNCGYRDSYIIDAAQRVSRGEIDKSFLRTAPLDEARKMIQTIKGVGPKVADCTLLFGAHRLDAFPRDVWIKRAMAELFPNGLPESCAPLAGVAQQYIFHYVRSSGILS